jgi:hypothetical protein
VKNPPQNVLNGVEQRFALFKSPLLYQVELRACVRNFYNIQSTSASSDSSAGSGSGEPENGLSTGFHSHQGVRCVRGGARASLLFTSHSAASDFSVAELFPVVALASPSSPFSEGGR